MGEESDRLVTDAAASVTGLVTVSGARVAALERVAEAAKEFALHPAARKRYEALWNSLSELEGVGRG